ncbi:helix-turn-helix domain-containing protein [Actinomycetaceae bacterium TAE3-ERU4]|nr:helix-turn-helix domain-containing protein [Actinomycetaceae bacterium TAE3-ERU4]
MKKQDDHSSHSERDMLVAMAHPVRLAILEELEKLGYARVTDLAEKLHLAGNSLSYHMKILARANLVVESPEKARDKRDRVWAINSRFKKDSGLDNPKAFENDEYLEAASMMARVLMVRWQKKVTQELDFLLSTARGNPRPQFLSLQAGSYFLDDEQRKQYAEDLIALAQKYAEISEENQENNSEAIEYAVVFGVCSQSVAQED